MTGSHDIKFFRQALERKKGRRDQIRRDLETNGEAVKQLHLRSIYCEEAQTIIQNVAQLTQSELEYHVSELVTLAMAAVFEDPYELKVEFTQRRGRTEADLFFVRGGAEMDPMGASGGGAVDVASFALRVALWSLGQPRTRNTLVLDEPLKWLKGGDLPEKGAAMIKEISDKLGLQIIMISHIPDQIEGADLRIGVRLKSDGVSAVDTH